MNYIAFDAGGWYAGVSVLLGEAAPLLAVMFGIAFAAWLAVKLRELV